MFDLETAIREWKKEFGKYESFEDGFLADMELHLREAYEAMKAEGLSNEAAFAKAVAQVGTAANIAQEYRKNRELALDRRSPWRPARFMPELVWNYAKVAIRKFYREKGYSIINIAGLATGLACCILMVLYIHSELSYDTFHKNAERIYALGVQSECDGYEFKGTSSNATAAEVLQKEYPQVAQAVRYGYKTGSTFDYEGKRFALKLVLYADENVFKVFTWPMIKGDPQKALSAPHTIVITEEIAERCFGKMNPLGRILKFGEEDAFVVTGVVKNVPDNSSINFDALCSFKTLYAQESLQRILTDWLSHNFSTYLLLKKGIKPGDLEKKFPALLERFAGPEMRARGATESLFLHPFTKLYLDPPWTSRGPIFYVNIFALVASLILLIACFNFMNLSTARSATRAHEVGIRKVFGASKKNLVAQFILESLFFSFVSLLLAVALVQLLLPSINSLTGRALSLTRLDLPGLISGFIILLLFVALMAGSYPAFLLSRFMPVKTLKRRLGSEKTNLTFRRVLVALQFVISIALVICAVIITRQLFYMQNIDPGFDKSNVVVIPAKDDVIRKSIAAVKEEFKKDPRIIRVAASSTIPGGGYANTIKIPEGYAESAAVLMDEINVDYDFLSTMGIKLVNGRNFMKESGADELDSVLINETAMKQFGWDNPIGKTIKSRDPRKPGNQYKEMTVIGVVKDFHLRNLNQKIEPIFIGNDSTYPLPFNYLDVLSVRIRPNDISGAIAFLREKWEKLFPNMPFEYYFLDALFNEQFNQIDRSRKIFSYFSFLAIFVACLGLYGMASFSAAQRTKEIGIRKVLGSTIVGIITLLGKELIGLILLANLAAWPLSFFLMNQWLSNFPIKTKIGMEIYLASSLGILLIGLLTVYFRAIKAARANPVDSLRYE
ncbi:MAG TPA: ABC transporter permease [Patescibacteria group bacterium]|nr:ABC transporter permease [Patescibacteria group bacterium]